MSPVRIRGVPITAGETHGADEIGTSLPCWCGEGEWRQRFRTPRFGLLRCSACGCYRIDPPPISSDEESPAFYSKYYDYGTPQDEESVPAAPPAGRPGRDARYWNVVSRYPPLTAVADTVVDVGCGDGDLSAELKGAGWRRVIGLEVSRARVARARKKYPGIDFFAEPLPNAHVSRGSANLVVLDNVIEHLPDPASQLAAIREALAPHGKLVVITPNMESGCFRLLGRRWTPELSPHSHIFLFTHAALRRLLESMGFEIETEGTFGGHYRARDLWRPFAQRQWKLAVWRLGQEAGLRYSRLIGAGPMLYAVVHRRADGPG